MQETEPGGTETTASVRVGGKFQDDSSGPEGEQSREGQVRRLKMPPIGQKMRKVH